MFERGLEADADRIRYQWPNADREIHHGIVQELGIANTALTTTKSQQRTFINGFE